MFCTNGKKTTQKRNDDEADTLSVLMKYALDMFYCCWQSAFIAMAP